MNNDANKNGFVFNFIDFIRYFCECKMVLISSIICMAIIGYVVAFNFFPLRHIAYLDVELNFKGIENGKNPNGTVFSPNQLIAPALMNKASEVMNHIEGTTKFQNMSQYISVNPVIPWVIKDKMLLAERNRQDFLYYPVKWKMIFSLNQNSHVQFTSQEMLQYLEELTNAYRQDIKSDENAQIVAVPPIERLKTLVLDPVDKLHYLNSMINSSVNNITNIMPKSEYISSSAGISFDSAIKALNNLSKITVANLLDASGQMQGVASPDIYLMQLKQRGEQLQLTAQKAGAEAVVAEKLFENVRKNKEDRNPHETARLGEARVDNDLINFIQKSDVQLLLIQKILEARMAESRALAEFESIRHQEQKIQKSDNVKEQQSLEAKLNKQIEMAIDETIYWGKAANQVYQEYMTKVCGSVMTITARTYSWGAYRVWCGIILGMMFIPLLLTAILAFLEQLVRKND